MIDIYILTMGRWLYLDKALSSIKRSLDPAIDIGVHIYSQGLEYPDPLINQWKDAKNWLSFNKFTKNIGIANAMNNIIPTLVKPLIMKMDEDCEIISRNFFLHIKEINKLKPRLVFSPYPVGLINNPGGPPKVKHEILYGDKLDTFYTFRHVAHIGGFARIAPRELVKDWQFPNDLDPQNKISGTEDGHHSNKCLANGIEMAYLENALIVEHQESTLGQHERYKEYFKSRF